MAVFFDTWQDITPSGTGAWEAKDLSAAPYSLPSTAVGIMGLVINGGVSQVNAGYRMYGSTDDLKAGVANTAQTPFYIGVDVDRKVELWRANADITFKLLGYFTDDEAVFFTNCYDKSPSPANGWRDMNCSVEIPADSPAAFVDISHGSACQAGLRKKSSTDVYKNFIPGKAGAIVALDVDRHYEAYTTSTTYGKHYLVGYLKKGTFKTDELDKSLTGVDVWESINLDPDVPANGTTGVLLHFRPATSSGYNHCARKKGSSDESYRIANLHTWWPTALNESNECEAKVANANLKVFVVGYFKPPEGTPGVYSEEGSIVIHSVVTGYNDPYEAREVVVQAQVQAWDNWEVRGVTVQAVVRGELNEEGMVLIKAEVGREYIRHLLDTGSVTARAILRAVTATPTPPRVKGRKPSPGETVVLRNQPVAFYIAGQGVDQVDINTVKVTIDGVEYTKASPNFIYSGFGDLYYVEVWHLDWGYVQTVNVRIDARSVLNQVMAPVTYSFQTVWEDPYTRSGWPRLELYYPGAYDLPALTIQENYVRQGIERYTAELGTVVWTLSEASLRGGCGAEDPARRDECRW